MRARGIVIVASCGLLVGGAFLACSEFSASSDSPPTTDGGDAQADIATDAPSPVDGADATTTSAYAAAVIADGPIVYWRMGSVGAANEVPDEMRSTNSLFLQGGGHELSVAGALAKDDPADNKAVRFDGVTSFAQAADAAAFDLAGQPFTVECWARREVIDGGGDYFQNLVGKIDGFNQAARGYSLYVAPAGQADETGGVIAASDASVGVFGRVIPTSVWAHYALVYDGAALALYINGTREQAMATNLVLPPRPGELIVGRDPRATNGYFPGAIDEIAIYARALSLPDVARHYQLGKP